MEIQEIPLYHKKKNIFHCEGSNKMEQAVHRELVEAPCLDIFKTQLDTTLGNLL